MGRIVKRVKNVKNECFSVQSSQGVKNLVQMGYVLFDRYILSIGANDWSPFWESLIRENRAELPIGGLPGISGFVSFGGGGVTIVVTRGIVEPFGHR